MSRWQAGAVKRRAFVLGLALLLAAGPSNAGEKTATNEVLREPARPLPWVNPARCLPQCAADPAEPLTRLDDLGRVSRAGKHRVAPIAVEPLRALLPAD